MSMAVQFRGEFWSLDGVRWKAEILKDGFSGTVTELHFPAGSPLTIEWMETGKLDPVQPSAATLTVVSDVNYEFTDLYAVAVGDVRLDVYREGALYWSGTLDTEVYEEPYTSGKDYDVPLTFSDFGVLDRLDYTGTGLKSMMTVISDCIALSAICHSGVVKHISTGTPMVGITVIQVANDILDLQVDCGLFRDDDDEPLTALEVLEGILQPLALRMVQKAGHVYIYDLNAVSALTPAAVDWAVSDDAVLSADVTYNNVTVTFDPAADAELMKGEVTESDQHTAASGGTLVYADYHMSGASMLSAEGFRIFIDDSLKSNMAVSGGARKCQIRSIYSGSDGACVLWSHRPEHWPLSAGGAYVTTSPNYPVDAVSAGAVSTAEIISMPLRLLPYQSYDSGRYRLKVCLQLLFDTRYNPFEEAGEYNEEGNYDRLKNWCNFAYVPVKLTVRDASGTALYHYVNSAIMQSSGYGASSRGSWVAGEAAWGDMWLAYYDHSDRRSSCGTAGWSTNKPIIGYYRDTLPSAWDKMDDGEYIPLPPAGGYLDFRIGRGVHQFDWNRVTEDIYSRIRWVMYREPSITLCWRNGIEFEAADIEDSAWIIRTAREKLELETKIGTPPGVYQYPTARGVMLAPDLRAVSTFSRGGVQDRAERLLITTAFSQYASRRTVLSGTVRLLPSFGVFSDTNQAGTFLPLSEVQDCMMDESEVKMSAISADDYQGVDYEQ